MDETVRKHFEDGLLARRETLESCSDVICRVAGLLLETVKAGGCIYLFGNGGSAADAQHIECELTGRYLLPNRRPLNARAITANVMATSAIANDFGYDHIFARHMELARSEDAVIGISTSGTSKNVLNGLQEARKHGARTIGLCGVDPAPMSDLCDEVIAVRSSHTPLIQELHITVGHVLCQLLEDSLGETSHG